MEPNMIIEDSYLEEVACSMNEILSDEFALCIKTRRAHCFLNDPDFHSKHILFEKQYHLLEGIIDDITERIRNLRRFPFLSSIAQHIDLVPVTEFETDSDSTSPIGILLAGHENILIHLREKIATYESILYYKNTRDYITGLLEVHQKMACLLQSQLE